MCLVLIPPPPTHTPCLHNFRLSTLRWEYKHNEFAHKMFGYLGNPDPSKTLWFGDETLKFEGVLFMGVESDLVLFNILLFTCLHMATQNVIFSLGIVYIVHILLCQVRAQLGEENIAAKTMVNERFLI